jgi:hypothetical protein
MASYSDVTGDGRVTIGAREYRGEARWISWARRLRKGRPNPHWRVSALAFGEPFVL